MKVVVQVLNSSIQVTEQIKDVRRNTLGKVKLSYD